MKTEGSGAARIVQHMRTFGYNKDVTIELATVITPLPDLSIEISSDGLVLDRDDLIVAEHLTEHTRIVNIPGVTIGDVQMTVRSALKVGDQVSTIGDDDTQLYYVFDKAVK